MAGLPVGMSSTRPVRGRREDAMPAGSRGASRERGVSPHAGLGRWGRAVAPAARADRARASGPVGAAVRGPAVGSGGPARGRDRGSAVVAGPRPGPASFGRTGSSASEPSTHARWSRGRGYPVRGRTTHPNPRRGLRHTVNVTREWPVSSTKEASGANASSRALRSDPSAGSGACLGVPVAPTVTCAPAAPGTTSIETLPP